MRGTSGWWSISIASVTNQTARRRLCSCYIQWRSRLASRTSFGFLQVFWERQILTGLSISPMCLESVDRHNFDIKNRAGLRKLPGRSAHFVIVLSKWSLPSPILCNLVENSIIKKKYTATSLNLLALSTTWLASSKTRWLFRFNPAEQHNKVYYGKLIDDVIKKEDEMNNFFTYLHQIANTKPKYFSERLAMI